MKNILFIIPYPLGSAPSQRFRFEQYFDILKKSQYSFDIAPFWSEKGWKVLYQNGRILEKSAALSGGIFRRCFLLTKIHRYDFIFIHREAMPLGPPIFELLIFKIFKKKVIYDFDDAVWLPNTSEQNRIVESLKYHRKVKYLCKKSEKVSCGNRFLADFAKQYNSKVFINPTTVDPGYHLPIKKNDQNTQVTVGWTGSHSTAKYLNQLAPLLGELQKKYRIKVLIISDRMPQWALRDFEFVHWSAEDETEQLNRIDIGIMPLDDTVWEKGKCGFKALQYMAVGIPAVVSDVGVNSQIIDHGINGFLCNSPEDWETSLTKLINSVQLRKEFGEKGRKKVIDAYSVTSNTTLFLSLFE